MDLQQSAPKKSVFINDIRTNATIRSSFLVKAKTVQMNKNSQPYLALTLSDKTGQIDCRIWEQTEALQNQFAEGDIIAVSGKSHEFQSRLQLVVTHLAKLEKTEIEWEDYFPKSNKNLAELYQNLIERFEAVEDPHLRALSLALLNDPEIAERYPICPAAKSIHHAYLGGLLEHSLQLIKVAEAIAPLYPLLNKDLLFFGAAFHDFGKIYEFSFPGSTHYTDEGKLVGHITIGAILVDRKIREIEGFPKGLEFHVKHLILSHHGRLEYGSPKVPQTMEALVVSQLDHLDSQLESIETLMRSEPSSQRWTTVHKAYQTSFYKPDTLVTVV